MNQRIPSLDNFINESFINEAELFHFVFLLPNGNYIVSLAYTEEDMKKQIELADAVEYKLVGKSGSYKEDPKQFNKMNNLAHSEGKKMKK